MIKKIVFCRSLQVFIWLEQNYVKKDSKDFHYNDIAQIISEICGISRRQMFNIEKPLKLQGLQKVGI